jgi:hypothetical protein
MVARHGSRGRKQGASPLFGKKIEIGVENLYGKNL